MIRLAGAILAASSALWAQLPPAQAPTPALSLPAGSKMHLTEYEAVVLDRSDHLAPDLTTSDFGVDTGQKVKIERLAYIDTRQRRIIVVVVDDLLLNTETLGQARSAIQKLIDGLHPEDRLAILRTGEGEGELQGLTNDREALERALERVQYNPQQLLCSAAAARTGVFASGALQTVREALDALRRHTGHKFLILFSPDLNDQTVKDADNLANAARRAETSVYGIDPVAQRATALQPSASSAGATPVEFTDFGLSHLDSAAGMKGLARQTGGDLIESAGRLDEALARAVGGPDGYYRVAFQDPEQWLPALSSSITLARPGYRLLSMRQVTESTSDLQSLSVPRQNEDDLARAMSNVFSTGDLHVRLTPLFYRISKGSMVQALVHFDVRGMSLRQGLDGIYHGRVETLAAAFTTSAQSVQHAAQSVIFDWTESQYQESLRDGVTVALQMNVPAGGTQIRAVVRDNASGRFGSASQWLDVPAVDKGQLAISGVTMDAPDDTRLENGQAGSPEANPWVRIFRAGQPIVYRCEIYNLGKEAVEITMQLTFFREGETPVKEAPMKIAYTAAEQAVVREAVGRITFGAGAIPGRYQLQFVVSAPDSSGGAPRTATRFVEFELRRP